MLDKVKRKSCQLILFGLYFIFFLYSHLLYAESESQLEILTQAFLQQNMPSDLRQAKISIRSPGKQSGTSQCQQKPTLRFTSQRRVGAVSIAINCTQPRWQRYVSATIDGELPVLQASNDILPGQALTQLNTQLIYLPVNQIKDNYLTSQNDLDRYSTRHFINANTPITALQLQAKLLVLKGNQVLISSQDASIHIEMPGIALESGPRDKQISVRNLSSGKIIKARIIAADKVSVD